MLESGDLTEDDLFGKGINKGATGNRRKLGAGLGLRMFDLLTAGSVNSVAWLFGHVFPGTDFDKKDIEGPDGKMYSRREQFNPFTGDAGVGAMLEGIYKEAIKSEFGAEIALGFSDDDGFFIYQ